MSDYQQFKGKLIEIKREYKESLEDLAKRLCKENKCHKKWGTYLDTLNCELSEKYYVSSENRVYLIKKDVCDDDCIFAAIRTDKGFEFVVRYHDDGLSFGMAIDEALLRVKEKI